MSESVAALTTVLVTIASYRAWDRPSWQRFAGVGGAVGCAALVRAEAVAMLLLLVVPLAARVPGAEHWRRRVRLGGVAAVAAVVVMAPWTVANLVRFEHPATLSTQAGLTLSAASCDDTFYGEGIGTWSPFCLEEDFGDGSVLEQAHRSSLVDFTADSKDGSMLDRAGFEQRRGTRGSTSAGCPS